jgi:2-C-methyl-D-erythritol 4-phosphate cytidylyltransferase
VSAPRAAVVVLAAGEGRRVGAATNKVLLPLAGLPVLAWSLKTVASLEYVDRVVVVTREEDRDVVDGMVREHLSGRGVDVVLGGQNRHASEWHALQAVADDIDSGRLDVVAIHDSARPLAGADLFRAVVDAAARHGGALPVTPQPGLIPREAPLPGPTAGEAPRPGPTAGEAPRPDGPEREHAEGADTGLVAVQTPQAFRAQPLLDAYRQAERDGFVGTDTASCVERYTDLRTHGVASHATNLKITFPEDLAVAERLLRNRG